MYQPKGEIANAVIEGTSLGQDGVLSAWLHLDYGGSGQGFGGYSLDAPIKDAAGNFLRREGTAYGMEFIARILKVVGVEKWEELKGRPIRADHDMGRVHAIGHYLKDEWFSPADLAEEMGLK